MKALIKIIVSLVLIWSSTVNAQRPNLGTLTLEQVIEMALESNEDIKIASEDMKGASAFIREARSGLLPNLRASGGYTRNLQVPETFVPGEFAGQPGGFIKMKFAAENLYITGLTLTQPLYMGGRLRATVDIARLYETVSKEAFRGTRHQVIFVAKGSFYTVLIAREALGVNEDALEAARRNLENVKALFEKGRVSEFDVLRAEVEVSNLEPTVTESENNVEIAYNNLKRVLGLPLSEEIGITGELVYREAGYPSEMELEAEALESRPEIIQLRLQKAILEKNLKIEKAGYLPTLSFASDWLYRGQNNEFGLDSDDFTKSLGASIQLSVPLFNGFNTSARVEQARVEMNKSVYRTMQLEEMIKLEVKSSYLEMNKAAKVIKARERSVGQAQAGLEMVEVRYSNGLATQLEVLDSQVVLKQTRLNYIRAVFDYFIAEAYLEKSLGRG